MQVDALDGSLTRVLDLPPLKRASSEPDWQMLTNMITGAASDSSSQSGVDGMIESMSLQDLLNLKQSVHSSSQEDSDEDSDDEDSGSTDVQVQIVGAQLITDGDSGPTFGIATPGLSGPAAHGTFMMLQAWPYAHESDIMHATLQRRSRLMAPLAVERVSLPLAADLHMAAQDR